MTIPVEPDRHTKSGFLKPESRFEKYWTNVSLEHNQTNYQVRFLWRLDFKRLRRLWLFILRRRFFFRLPMEIFVLYDFRKKLKSQRNALV